MIGLLKGLAWQAYKDTWHPRDYWECWWREDETFGLVMDRERAKAHRTSSKFFQLIDGCPLRLPHNG
jgi:hypothetical protein